MQNRQIRFSILVKNVIHLHLKNTFSYTLEYFRNSFQLAKVLRNFKQKTSNKNSDLSKAKTLNFTTEATRTVH